MKLKDAMEKATIKEATPTMQCLHDAAYTPLNAALISHWFNHGPKLLEALEEVDHFSEESFNAWLNKRDRVIAEASEVEGV